MDRTNGLVVELRSFHHYEAADEMERLYALVKSQPCIDHSCANCEDCEGYMETEYASFRREQRKTSLVLLNIGIWEFIGYRLWVFRERVARRMKALIVRLKGVLQ